MIKLFDRLNQETFDLEYSLSEAGFQGTSVVLNDDGYLPVGFTSPYAFFGEYPQDVVAPLYFNEVPVPKLWQITGTNTQGEIWNYGDKKANIYYHDPKHLRLVRSVDWIGQNGKVYVTDHYNQQGQLFAKTYFDQEQRLTHKIYYDASSKEVIVENIVTGDILLDWQGKTYHFSKRVDFFLFYLRESGLDTSKIWYNSLAMPFLISYYLGNGGDDILFWQEDITDQVPGNMRLILSQKTARTKKIVVQKRETYERLMALLSPEEQKYVDYLGYIYPSKRENHNQKEILILTNSDNIEGLDSLLAELSEYHFHIAALTEMSQRLMQYASSQQVTLYPNISPNQVERLFKQCDIYLDINHGSEIMSAVRSAFESNLVIAAFDNTKHHPEFMLEEAIFNHSAPIGLANWLKECDDLTQIVAKQRSFTGQEDVERYQNVLNQ